jgi:hypothetical protein
MSETVDKVERMRALQARRSALVYFTDLTNPATDKDEVGKAIRRISSELDDMTQLKVVK